LLESRTEYMSGRLASRSCQKGKAGQARLFASSKREKAVLIDRVLEAFAGGKLRHRARRNLHFRARLRIAAGRSRTF